LNQTTRVFDSRFWFRGSEVLWFYAAMIRRPAGAFYASVAMAVPLVFFAAAAWSRRWMSDDGYIYLRVVRQLIDGNGPVYNPGERVEATTSPAWLYLLALAKEVAQPAGLPWIAVVLGLALSIAGLALAQWGAYRLWSDRRGVIVPLGSLVVAATPAFWDFATSGLETGLSFFWLGACSYALVSTLPNTSHSGPLPLGGRGVAEGRGEGAIELRSSTLVPLLLGAGPLVRPDFAIFSVAFLAAMFVARRPRSPREWLQPIALALALPLAYEVFRAGYYAALVPNPAFAKEASQARWDQGWTYLWDTLRTYWLLTPLALVLVAALPSLFARRRDGAALAVIAAPVGAGLAHGLYTVYVGGDFMHARMLLPAIFALAMPFAVIAVDWRAIAPAAGVIAWAVVCAVALRPSYDAIGPHGIANERAYYVSLARNAHPVTLADYAQYEGEAYALIKEAELIPGYLLLVPGEQLPLRPGVRANGAVFSSSIGIHGYVFDDDVVVVDLYGLADPVAGRLELTERGRPGHEKVLPLTWVVARFADPSTFPARVEIAAAREALACGDLRRLLEDVSAPMSARRFAGNVVDAFRLHRFRLPADPGEARDALC
jgi:arabinofuranosyltransferase